MPLPRLEARWDLTAAIKRARIRVPPIVIQLYARPLHCREQAAAIVVGWLSVKKSMAHIYVQE
jgi:hypothetical protein